MPVDARPPTAVPLDEARRQFAGGRGYLASCTMGIPTNATRQAVIADLETAAMGRASGAEYTAVVERTRAHFARLVGVAPARVAIGSQASVFTGLLASALPDGAEVLCADGDFSSVMAPFAQAGRGIRVRTAPLAELAGSISRGTGLVAFSLVQSATGEVADVTAIRSAAAAYGVPTLCDATQAVGWLPVAADDFDAMICHAYKWLCAPRGAAFLTVREGFAHDIRPINAGWYAGRDPWTSCYGHDIELAPDVSRFDLSPAWQAFVGAEPALELFASIDPSALHSHVTDLAAAFRRGLGLGHHARPSAIVTWSDPGGTDLARLTAAGMVASGRAGRARVAFHLFNDEQDVADALTALGR